MENYSKRISIFPWVYNPFLDDDCCKGCSKKFEKGEELIKIKINEYVPKEDQKNVGTNRLITIRAFCQPCGDNLTVEMIDSWINY